MLTKDDKRWLAAAASLAERARPLSAPNPGVGAIVVKDGVVAGRGWTQAGGRPHAEAMALQQAGSLAQGATVYATLEPCAHISTRGPSCADTLIAAGIARCVIGVADPDPRTNGTGAARLAAANIAVTVADDPACERSLMGYLTQKRLGRPYITLKLASSLDGAIALANGESQWITGAVARAHVHRERARSDAILVGGGTLRADNPRLDVRLGGLETRSPQRWALTGGPVPQGWQQLAAPQDVVGEAMAHVQYLYIEGGAKTAAAFLQAGLVDELQLYRAPILIGAGLPALGSLGLTHLSEAHGRWSLAGRRQLSVDCVEIYR